MRRSMGWLSLVLAFGCGGREASTRAEPESAREVRVTVARPTPTEGTHRLRLPGALEAYETAPLHARVTGYIERIQVDLGDQVEEGQTLAVLTAPERLAEATEARTTVAQRAAELSEAEARTELARLTHERLTRLATREQGAVSRQRIDEAAAERQLADARLEVARAALGSARASASRAQTFSGYRTIKAPFAGRITARHLHPGSLAREGSTSGAVPLLELARTDPLRVVFDVPEPLPAHVRAGMIVSVRLSADAEPIELEIVRVAGALSDTTRTMRVEADLPNPDGSYQPGAYASIELSVERLVGAPTIPSSAVRGSGDERYVLVADQDDVLRRRPVTIAADDGRAAVVGHGLSMDDRVVVAGSVLAEDGERAVVAERDRAEGS